MQKFARITTSYATKKSHTHLDTASDNNVERVGLVALMKDDFLLRESLERKQATTKFRIAHE